MVTFVLLIKKNTLSKAVIEEFVWAYDSRGIKVHHGGNMAASDRRGSRSRQLNAYLFRHKQRDQTGAGAKL